MDAAVAKFIERYKQSVKENQTHILFKVAHQPIVQAALLKGKQPARKTVEKLFREFGIDAVAPAEEEASNAEATKMTTNTGGEYDFKNVAIMLQKIQSGVEDLNRTINTNIEVAIPSSQIYTDLLLSSEDRAKFARQRQKENMLESDFRQIYLRLCENFDPSTVIFVTEVLIACLPLIDSFNDYYIKRFRFSGNTDVLSKGIEMKILAKGKVPPKIFSHVCDKMSLTLTKFGYDPFILVVNKSTLDAVTHYRLDIYIDLDTLFTQFETIFARKKTESHVGIASAIEEDPLTPLTVLKDGFPSYFLKCTKDVYVHILCTLQKFDPNYSHDYVFSDIYRKVFGI